MGNPPREADIPTKPRRLLRLSVRALMVLILILAVALGWTVHRARVQRDAVAAIRQVGGIATYGWDMGRRAPNTPPPGPNWPKWLVDPLGVDYFGDVVHASVPKDPDDALLAHIGRLSKLRSLMIGLNRSNEVTDAGVAPLSGLVDLESLNFRNSKATGACLASLRNMTKLKNLDLTGLPITDDDLVHLEGLINLETLTLSGSTVGDSGLVHLAGLVNLKHLRLDGTQITGPGLAHLDKLTNLLRLFLEKSRVRDLSQLPTLPGLTWLILDDTPVDDAQLDALSRLAGLKQIGLARTGVTDAGVAKLQGFQGSLKGITLGGTRITDASAPTLALFNQVTNLSLDGTKVTDATLDQLGSLAKLNVINLDSTAITDVGLARLRKAVPGMKTEKEFYDAQRARNAARRPPPTPAPAPAPAPTPTP